MILKKQKALSLILALLMIFALIISGCAKNPEDNPSDTSKDISSVSKDEPVTPPQGAELSESTLKNKILGAWVGQMAGVAWGASQEFWFTGKYMQDSEVPPFSDFSVNDAFTQDDIYVEITYIEQMMKTGYNSTLKQLADAFRDSKYGLDHANKQGRENLRNGIEAPESGSYKYNFHCDDIDWQINSDFIGQIYPGNPKAAADRSFELGHITNYGDGVYGGVFVSAMNAAAYTAKSVDEIIKAGLSVIPDGTKFKNAMNDVVKCHSEMKDWHDCWEFIQKQYGNDDRCLWYGDKLHNIDAKINAAYVLMGLLYGDGDFTNSVKIAMQCGQDSDCNPSTVGGILGTFYGFNEIDDQYKKGLDMNGTKFLNTNLNLTQSVSAMTAFAKEAMKTYAKEFDGKYYINAPECTPVPFEQWPDMPTAELLTQVDGASVTLNFRAHDLSGIKSVEFDLGDGAIFPVPIGSYTYEKAGKYTIKYKVISNNSKELTGQVEVTTTKDAPAKDIGEVGKLRNIAAAGIPICSVTSPQGTGNKDLNILSDGIKGNVGEWELSKQYDTFTFNTAEHEDFFGYIFRNPFYVVGANFTEGMNFDNGGWFKDGMVRMEVLTDSGLGDRLIWQDVAALITPEYHKGNTQADQGPTYESFKFEGQPMVCRGVRIIGLAGGSAGFASCSELEVFGVEDK